MKYSRTELDVDGLVVNPHMWIGNGFFYCPTCKRYAYHYAMSHPGLADCYEVCEVCGNYNGSHKLINLKEDRHG